MSDESNFEAVSPERAAELVASGAQLVDVREDYEWEAGRIPGAVHIPLAELPTRHDEIDASGPVVLQCRSGGRSAMAAEALAAAGVEAYNLDGGILAWVEGGREIEPADGEVAEPGPDGA